MSPIIDYNARAYPSPKEDGSQGIAILLTVLVKRVDGVKAYAGIVPDTSREDKFYDRVKPWIAQHGNALRLEEARDYFVIRDGEYCR